MRRREFITLISGTAAAWPLAARAQQLAERMRRIGVLMNFPSDDSEGQARVTAFALLKELAPNVTRVGVVRDPAAASGIGQFAVIQSSASSSRVELSAIDTRDVGEMERALGAFAQEPNGGVIIAATSSAVAHLELIISLTMRYRLPNVYAFSYYPARGGLASYGPNTVSEFPRAAGYVDRVLKGERPANLPVQAPTKYELVINLKTAKALGLTMPQTLLLSADEVIE